jgi:hypothetical protein
MTSFWNTGSSSLMPCLAAKPPRVDMYWKPASPLGSMMPCRQICSCAMAALAPPSAAMAALAPPSAAVPAPGSATIAAIQQT